MEASQMLSSPSVAENPLYDKWVLWAHLPHDTDWSLNSYKNIMEIDTVEGMIALYKNSRIRNNGTGYIVIQ